MIPTGLRPLRHERFRWLWAAGVLSFFGTWVHNVAARWTAATLSSSPFVISLVDALQSLPIVLLSLVAGRMVDTLDRRSLLVGTNLSLAAVSVCMGLLSATNKLGLPALLVLTALLGSFLALDGPAWQSTIPRQVPEDELHGSVALVSMGYNAARTVGPALGAWLLASLGASTAFMMAAATFVVMAITAARLLPPLRPEHPAARPPQFLTPTLRRLYGVVLIFSVFAMPSMSLLPVVAREAAGGGALSYGLLVTSFGLGAVVSGFFVASATARLGYNRFVAVCGAASGIGLAVQSLAPTLPIMMAAAALSGAGWLGAISITNSMVNASSSERTRGRALAVYFVFAFAGQFAGSLGGGLAAEFLGLSLALQILAMLLALFTVSIYRARTITTP